MVKYFFKNDYYDDYYLNVNWKCQWIDFVKQVYLSCYYKTNINICVFSSLNWRMWCWELEISWRLRGLFCMMQTGKTKSKHIISWIHFVYLNYLILGKTRFHIDLGSDANDLALHFNPRFHDNTDGSVLVFNSKTAGCWGEERREIPNPLHRGKEVKVRKIHWVSSCVLP